MCCEAADAAQCRGLCKEAHCQTRLEAWVAPTFQAAATGTLRLMSGDLRLVQRITC